MAVHQVLECRVLKDCMKVHQPISSTQAPHEVNLPLQARQVLGLHLGLLIRLDDDWRLSGRAHSLVDSGDAATESMYCSQIC